MLLPRKHAKGLVARVRAADVKDSRHLGHDGFEKNGLVNSVLCLVKVHVFVLVGGEDADGAGKSVHSFVSHGHCSSLSQRQIFRNVLSNDGCHSLDGTDNEVVGILAHDDATKDEDEDHKYDHQHGIQGLASYPLLDVANDNIIVQVDPANIAFLSITERIARNLHLVGAKAASSFLVVKFALLSKQSEEYTLGAGTVQVVNHGHIVYAKVCDLFHGHFVAVNRYAVPSRIACSKLKYAKAV